MFEHEADNRSTSYKAFLVRMWQDTGITIFMVTHDVDEAILLSDRIMLMSRGPDAKIMEEIKIDIPRPRTRASIVEDPKYYEIRNRIIHFLTDSTSQVKPVPVIKPSSKVEPLRKAVHQ